MCATQKYRRDEGRPLGAGVQELDSPTNEETAEDARGVVRAWKRGGISKRLKL
jgi:hypothetical protein